MKNFWKKRNKKKNINVTFELIGMMKVDFKGYYLLDDQPYLNKVYSDSHKLYEVCSLNKICGNYDGFLTVSLLDPESNMSLILETWSMLGVNVVGFGVRSLFGGYEVSYMDVICHAELNAPFEGTYFKEGF